MENKSCDNCYWTANHGKVANRHCAFKDEKPIENICDTHDFYCDHCKYGEEGDWSYDNTAEYEYNGKYYCFECLLKAIDVEKRPVEYYHYYLDGEYLSMDENDVIDILAKRMNVSYI